MKPSEGYVPPKEKLEEIKADFELQGLKLPESISKWLKQYEEAENTRVKTNKGN